MGLSMQLVCITLCSFSFVIILTRKRGLFALLLLSFGCLVTVNVWLFFTLPWVGLHCMIVVFPECVILFFAPHSQDNAFSLLTIKNLKEWYFLTKANLKIVYNCILVHLGRI